MFHDALPRRHPKGHVKSGTWNMRNQNTLDGKGQVMGDAVTETGTDREGKCAKIHQQETILATDSYRGTGFEFQSSCRAIVGCNRPRHDKGRFGKDRGGSMSTR